MTAAVESNFYVVFDAEIRGGRVRAVKARRLTQSAPALSGGEVALKFSASIPENAFLRLIPDVAVTIPDGWWTSSPVEVVAAQPPEA